LIRSRQPRHCADSCGRRIAPGEEEQERLALSSLSTRRRNDLLPSIALLKRSARRLRRLDPARVREVAAAINALGFCDPLLIGHDNEIIDGDTRFEAALQLGIDQVPCVRIDHLTPQEQRALRLAVNRLAEKGEWDLDALKVEFEELVLTDAPIEIIGFSGDEIDQNPPSRHGRAARARVHNCGRQDRRYFPARSASHNLRRRDPAKPSAKTTEAGRARSGSSSRVEQRRRPLFGRPPKEVLPRERTNGPVFGLIAVVGFGRTQVGDARNLHPFRERLVSHKHDLLRELLLLLEALAMCAAMSRMRPFHRLTPFSATPSAHSRQ
jgi:hypothetical protein